LEWLRTELTARSRENSRQGVGIVIDDIDAIGRKVLVGIHKNSDMDRRPVNTIESIYGLDHPAEWIANQIESGKQFVLYDENRANAYLQTYGYLASVEDGIRSIDNNATTGFTNSQGGKKSLKTREALDQYIEQYGEIPAGEKPAREIHLPSRTARNMKVSRTVRTIMEASATPEEVLPKVQALADYIVPGFAA